MKGAGRRGWEGLAYVDGGTVGSEVAATEVSSSSEGVRGCCGWSVFGTVSGGGGGWYVGISQTWCSHGLPVVVPQTAKGVADVGRFGGGLVICAGCVEVDLVKRRGQGYGVG